MAGIITHPIFIWTVSILLGSGLIFWMISYIVASFLVYKRTLRRESKDHWSREFPSDTAPDSLEMDALGLAWQEKHNAYKEDVHIVHKGLNLYGEYYDLGKERCVVILSGRTESLRYGYYFAIPYSESCNVLVIDPRAHGKSDGEFNTVGFEESGDAIAWVNFLQEKYHVKSVIFHGICIGAAAGMFAITSENCPACVDGIVTEGMFPYFGESMKNNLKFRKKPVFILYEMINGWAKHYTGHSMNYGPIHIIEKLNKPLLMLHSKEDLFSKPDYAQKLFDLAGTKQKTIVWFEKGKHSKLRITDTEKYDTAIADFLKNSL